MADRACLRCVVGLAVASVLLGACATGSPARHAALDRGVARSAATPPAGLPSPPAAASNTSKAREKHRPYSDVNPRPRHGGDFVVTVLSLTVEEPRGRHPLRPHRTKWETWREEVRTCVKPSSRHDETVGWRDWRAEGIRGHIYPADPHHPRGSAWTPTYPVRTVLSPGQCATGYWLIIVPSEAIRAIQFAPDHGPVLIEWPTPR
jgi:hypothetical protein